MSFVSHAYRLALFAISFTAGTCGLAQHAAWPGNCNDCQTASVGHGLGHGHWAARHEEARQQLQKIDARNRAWPKPFDCWDAQAYNLAWTQNLAAGFDYNCTLRDCHFDAETGQLNPLGMAKLGEIVSTPQAQAVLVASHFNPKTAEGRLQVVRDALRDQLGAGHAWTVAVSNQEPIRFSGTRTAGVNAAYQQQLQPPIIPVNVGQSVSSATSGN